VFRSRMSVTHFLHKGIKTAPEQKKSITAMSDKHAKNDVSKIESIELDRN